MNKEDFKKLVDKPEMISGIFNYCDRWCERCNLTHRCATFAIEQEQFADPEKDMKNEAFWEKLSEIFAITMEMIREDAEALGIDLDDIDTTEIDAANEQVEELTDNHPCSKLSKNYGTNVRGWFDEAESLLDQKAEALAKNDRLGIEDNEAKELNDVIEVISWYQYQIYIKIKRGLHGKFDNMEEDVDFPKDSDGSVKVALIGIDRSIAAWGKMLILLPDKEDEILGILVHLEKLRRTTEHEFPMARNFVRVGFDD